VQLLEREGLLESLTEYADAARVGESRLVLVAGEAGVGKTSLIEALRARATDARWLWGACDGAFTPMPLGPLFDVASQVGGDLADACRDDAPRERMFRALLDELTQSQQQLTVLVIEDVHWADEATLDLVSFLARRLRNAKTLVAVTYRDDGLSPDHPLRTTLGELATERTTRRVGLAPLTQDAVRRLANANGSGIEPTELYHLTGGNPFLVTEVLDAGTGDIPPSASEAVLARVARLSADARKVLEAAAVIGMRVEVDVLRAVTTDDADAIDECLTSGALVSDTHVFRFRHELARRALEESIPAHRRTELHRQILDVLKSTGVADHARLAYHADGVADGAAVLQHAPLAAQRASSLGAHTEALAQYQRAVRYAEQAQPRRRAELYAALGKEAAMVDRWEEVAAALESSLAIWTEVGDLARVGDTWREIARAMWRLCRGEEMLAAAHKSVEVLEALPPTVELANAYALSAGLRQYDEPDDAMEMAERSIALAEEFGANDVLSRALNFRACMLIARGEDAFALLERARDIAIENHYEELVGLAWANLHEMATSSHHFSLAQRVFDDGIAYAQDHEIDTFTSCLYGGHAHVMEKLGRYDEALSLLVDVLGRRHVSPVNRLLTVMSLARIYGRRGHPDAKSALDEATELAAGGVEPPYRLELALTRAELAWLDGRTDEAVAAVRAAVEDVACGQLWQQGWVASWARRLGVDGAETAATPGPYAAEIAGDWRAAADAWLALGCRYDAALALLDAPDEAALREAVALLDAIGATATVTAAQAIMRKRGIRTIPRGARAATRADKFGLTAREREVLALICTGMTNSDIASKLFIVEKTVDNHVSSVLAKLDVGSRREAARKAAESGLVEPAPLEAPAI
jgi:DNA-binding CsgD family transcriptional regulator/tetratricopeptide (TPR) repeat protein